MIHVNSGIILRVSYLLRVTQLGSMQVINTQSMLCLDIDINIPSFTVPDPCLSSPCDPNAVCTGEGPLSSNFDCACTSPFEGDGFTCSSEFTCYIFLIQELFYV